MSIVMPTVCITQVSLPERRVPTSTDCILLDITEDVKLRVDALGDLG